MDGKHLILTWAAVKELSSLAVVSLFTIIAASINCKTVSVPFRHAFGSGP